MDNLKVEFTFALKDIRETFRQIKSSEDSPMPFSALDLDELYEFVYESAQDVLEEYLTEGIDQQIMDYE